MIRPPIPIALNASTYTAIEVPTASHARYLGYYVDDETAYYQATSSAGANAILVPEKTKITEAIQDDAGIIFYAKASAGTPNMVVKIGEPA